MLSDDGPDGKTYGIVLTTPFAVRRWVALGRGELREMERMDRVVFFNAATRRDKAGESAALLALVRVIQQLTVANTRQ
jgi:hypothetical protein